MKTFGRHFVVMLAMVLFCCMPRAISLAQPKTETEPNDEQEQANALTLDADVTGHLNPAGDLDWFVFTVPAGDEILTIEITAVPNVVCVLELMDEKGETLKVENFGAEGTGARMGSIRPKPGKYYLRVKADEGFNEEKSYTLHVGKPLKPAASEAEVQKALSKALSYLATNQQPEGNFANQNYGNNAGLTGLGLLAFLGAKCETKDYAANIKAALGFLKSKYRPSSDFEAGSDDAILYGGIISDDDVMYEHAIATLAMIEVFVERNDSSLDPIIEDALNLIVRTQNTEHKPASLNGPAANDSDAYGGWRYHPGGNDSDISVTGWFILALRAALNVGFTVPDWCLPKAAQYVKTCREEDSLGFAYQAHTGDVTGARTGIGVLGLQLAGFPSDPLIAPAVRYLQDNPPLWETEPGNGGYPFYYWYYASRVMLNLGGDDWRLWSSLMCRLLVDRQSPDGSWAPNLSEQEIGPLFTTELGAMILEYCCGYVPIYMQKKVVRPGSVEVTSADAHSDAAKCIELILDASNSMRSKVGKESKINIAKRALTEIVNGLPESMEVGLRLYGHRYQVKDSKACEDSELVIPIGPVAKSKLVESIAKVNPMGKTPLIYSILQAAKDFSKKEKSGIILISDGIESCNGDIASIAPALKQSGIDFKVQIVGFDIKEASERKQLEAIAASTGGRFYAAENSQDLLSALRQTIEIPYLITDEKGETKAQGIVGGAPVKIMAGSYTLKVQLEPKAFESKITVTSGGKISYQLSQEQGAWQIKEKKE